MNQFKLKSAKQVREMLNNDLSLLNSVLEHASEKYSALMAKRKFYRASLWDDLHHDAIFLVRDYVHSDETKISLRELWPLHADQVIKTHEEATKSQEKTSDCEQNANDFVTKYKAMIARREDVKALKARGMKKIGGVYRWPTPNTSFAVPKARKCPKVMAEQYKAWKAGKDTGHVSAAL